MAQLIAELDIARVRENVRAVRAEIDAAARRSGRDPGDVELLAAVKYVPLELMETLAAAGVALVGENRAQDLLAKSAAHPDAFTWDFIGRLQSRKVPQLLPHVRYLHSVATESALAQLARHGTPATRVLVEVNVGGEDAKSGVEPAELASFLERCPVTVAGLMTMPPLAADPESSRPYFAALRELAARHGLRELSMGTTQDFGVAVEEGATIVRVGRRLYD